MSGNVFHQLVGQNSVPAPKIADKRPTKNVISYKNINIRNAADQMARRIYLLFETGLLKTELLANLL